MNLIELFGTNERVKLDFITYIKQKKLDKNGIEAIEGILIGKKLNRSYKIKINLDFIEDYLNYNDYYISNEITINFKYKASIYMKIMNTSVYLDSVRMELDRTQSVKEGVKIAIRHLDNKLNTEF